MFHVGYVCLLVFMQNGRKICQCIASLVAYFISKSEALLSNGRESIEKMALLPCFAEFLLKKVADLGLYTRKIPNLGFALKTDKNVVKMG